MTFPIFNVSSAILSSHAEINSATRLRFVVVGRTKSGGLPKKVTISVFNSADAIEQARDLRTRLEKGNPGTTVVILDRLDLVEVG
jgi:hypothetical protein